MAAYGLSLWDAHMWGCVEVHQPGILDSEDFEHERWYGGVLVLNPFRIEDEGCCAVLPAGEEIVIVRVVTVLLDAQIWFPDRPQPRDPRDDAGHARAWSPETS